MRDVVVVAIRKQQDEGPALHSTREHPRPAAPNGHVSPIFCMRPALVDAAPAKIPAACQRERKRKPNNARGSYRLVSTRPRQQSIVPAWADNSHKKKSMSIQKKTQIGSCELICGTAASKAHNRPASAEPRPVRPLRQANVSQHHTTSECTAHSFSQCFYALLRRDPDAGTPTPANGGSPVSSGLIPPVLEREMPRRVVGRRGQASSTWPEQLTQCAVMACTRRRLRSRPCCDAGRAWARRTDSRDCEIGGRLLMLRPS